MRNTVNPDLFALLVIAIASLAGFHAFLLTEYTPDGFAEVNGVNASGNLMELRTPCHSLKIAVSDQKVESINSISSNVRNERIPAHEMMEDLMSPLTVMNRAAIKGLEDGRYAADSVVRDLGVYEREVDSEPSDAVVLAMGTGSDIFVSESLLREEADFTCDGTV